MLAAPDGGVAGGVITAAGGVKEDDDFAGSVLEHDGVLDVGTSSLVHMEESDVRQQDSGCNGPRARRTTKTNQGQGHGPELLAGAGEGKGGETERYPPHDADPDRVIVLRSDTPDVGPGRLKLEFVGLGKCLLTQHMPHRWSVSSALRACSGAGSHIGIGRVCTGPAHLARAANFNVGPDIVRNTG